MPLGTDFLCFEAPRNSKISTLPRRRNSETWTPDFCFLISFNFLFPRPNEVARCHWRWSGPVCSKPKKKTKQKRASTFGTGPTRVAANVNSTSTVNGVVPGKIGLHINASSSVRGREIRVWTKKPALHVRSVEFRARGGSPWAAVIAKSENRFEITLMSGCIVFFFASSGTLVLPRTAQVFGHG